MDESTSNKDVYELLKFHAGHNVLLTHYNSEASFTIGDSIGLACESCDQDITYWRAP
jgi:hypothetical protein